MKVMVGYYGGFSQFKISLSVVCLGWCMFVCLYPINAKTTELIGSKFFVGPRVTLEKVMDDQIFKALLLTKFHF